MLFGSSTRTCLPGTSLVFGPWTALSFSSPSLWCSNSGRCHACVSERQAQDFTHSSVGSSPETLFSLGSPQNSLTPRDSSSRSFVQNAVISASFHSYPPPGQTGSPGHCCSHCGVSAALGMGSPLPPRKSSRKQLGRGGFPPLSLLCRVTSSYSSDRRESFCWPAHSSLCREIGVEKEKHQKTHFLSSLFKK